MSDVEKEVASRRDFVKGATAVVAGAAVLGSLSCGQSKPPETETPKAEPKSHAMTREEYLEYVACFNRKDFEAVANYFTPDITVEYYDNATGPKVTPRTLYGPQQFIENYKGLTSTVKEVLELRDYVDQRSANMELYTEFHPLKTSRQAKAGRHGRWASRSS
jgi:ketosteroid isomerase-like protein